MAESTGEIVRVRVTGIVHTVRVPTTEGRQRLTAGAVVDAVMGDIDEAGNDRLEVCLNEHYVERVAAE